jgi:hypothetical protein
VFHVLCERSEGVVRISPKLIMGNRVRQPTRVSIPKILAILAKNITSMPPQPHTKPPIIDDTVPRYCGTFSWAMSIRREKGNIRNMPRKRKVIICSILAICTDRNSKIRTMEKKADRPIILRLPMCLASSEPMRGPTAHPKENADKKNPIIFTEAPLFRRRIGTKLYKFIAVILIARASKKMMKMGAIIFIKG